MKTSSESASHFRRRNSSLAKIPFFAIAISCLLLTSALYGQDSVGQVTTYATLTSRNTSAAPGSTLQAGTGTPSENVSKIPITSLLAPGSSTRVFTHLPVWFGSSSHQDVGYNSVDANQVRQQVADMLSRGINGVIVNWHGPSDFTDQAAILVMREAQNYSGDFEFAIEEDAQAFAPCAATPGCDVTAKAVSDLTYLQSTYANDSKYMKYKGRPVIFLYGMEGYQLDWSKIRASLPGEPVLVFRSATVATVTPFAPGAASIRSAWAPFSNQLAKLSGIKLNDA